MKLGTVRVFRMLSTFPRRNPENFLINLTFKPSNTYLLIVLEFRPHGI
jgi:hypothetical protein